MPKPSFIANEETKAYYRNTLDLVRADFEGENGYDEIYILSKKDLQNISRNDSLIMQGQMFHRLMEKSPSHATLLGAALRGSLILAEVTGDVKNASLSIMIKGKDERTDLRAGIIMLSDKPVALSTSGLSGESQSLINNRINDYADDQKRYFILPHELGHLRYAAAHNAYGLHTDMPVGSGKESAAFTREGEIYSDEYAKDVFLRAQSLNMVGDKTSLQDQLDHRVIASIDEVVMNEGAIQIHTTTPFMKGSAFADGDRAVFDKAADNIAKGVAESLDRTMHSYAMHDSALVNGKDIWSRSIRQCFSGASDNMSLPDKKPVSRPSADQNIDLRDTFRSCVMETYGNRFKLLSEQHEQAVPGSSEYRVLDMYMEAAERAIPAPERKSFVPTAAFPGS